MRLLQSAPRPIAVRRRQAGYAVALITLALSVPGCGGGQSTRSGGRGSSTAAKHPFGSPAAERPKVIEGVVYTRSPPHISRGCTLLRVGTRKLGGPHGAYWLVQPPAPTIQARRFGDVVEVRWALPRRPSDCQPAWLDLTVISVRDNSYAGGTLERPIRVTRPSGTATIRVLPGTLGPYAVVGETAHPDGKIRSKDAQVPLG
jgi:hypothetical protein